MATNNEMMGAAGDAAMDTKRIRHAGADVETCSCARERRQDEERWRDGAEKEKVTDKLGFSMRGSDRAIMCSLLQCPREWQVHQPPPPPCGLVS